MRGIMFSFFLAALFVSCAGEPDKRVLTPDAAAGAVKTPDSYIITDHKTNTEGKDMPEWVNRYYNGGVHAVETLDAYHGRYVYVSRSEGNNFNALNHWIEGFSTELDFPRLAAARIEARFSSGVIFPDNEYGAFYEAMIRAASDAAWKGAVKEDDFWIRRASIPGDAGAQQTPAENLPQVQESWEFLILVTIDKNVFASQLDEVFQSIKPNPNPSRDQTAAANRIKENFFEGF